MIVFDLRCGEGHVFEAWFASGDAFADQQARGLVSCPLCGNGDVAKAPMAPAVPAKSNAAAVPMAMPDAAQRKAMLATLATMQARMLEGSDWVGVRFAEEARAMHDGEADDRPIHGQATLAEAKALLDDGIGVAPLPLPVRPPGGDH